MAGVHSYSKSLTHYYLTMTEHSGASRPRSDKKGWWRDLFLDIPDHLASGIDQFYGSLKSNKTKSTPSVASNIMLLRHSRRTNEAIFLVL
jgi:hypothetical protein